MFPVLFYTDKFLIPTYFVIISITCCVCLWWGARRAQKLNLPRNTALDLVLLVMVSGFLGARIFHVIFEYPDIYIAEPLRIFKFWEGGFVFYGGAILGFLTGLLFILKKRENVFDWLDFAAPVAALGYALGRIGCFFAGCCYGRYCSLPWAVTFPRGVEAPGGVPIHPTQIYAFLAEMLTFSALLWLDKSRKNKSFKLYSKPGDLFYLWMMFHGLGRIIMEMYRDDYRGKLIFGITLSTSISLVLVFSGVALYLFDWRKKA